MIDKDKRASLRGMLGVGLGAVATYAATRTASAQDQKLAQNIVQYQQTPKDGAECDKCVNWVAAERLQDRRGRHQPEGLVRRVRPEGGLALTRRLYPQDRTSRNTLCAIRPPQGGRTGRTQPALCRPAVRSVHRRTGSCPSSARRTLKSVRPA